MHQYYGCSHLLLDGFLGQTEHGVSLLLFVGDAPAELCLHGAGARDCHTVHTPLQGHLDIVLGAQQLPVRVTTPAWTNIREGGVCL